uniref:Uncharacterized protein n=1 Tax=Arundo donax TaxID=35708 RepID=A0A0A9ARN2_ARUDO
MLRTAPELSTSGLDMLPGLRDTLSCPDSNLALVRWCCGLERQHRVRHMDRLREDYLATQRM